MSLLAYVHAKEYVHEGARQEERFEEDGTQAGSCLSGCLGRATPSESEPQLA